MKAKRGLSGWTIKLTKDGQPDGSAVTDSAGYLQLYGVRTGHLHGDRADQTGWTQTLREQRLHGNGIERGTNVPNNNFGNFQNITISGMKVQRPERRRAPG